MPDTLVHAAPSLAPKGEDTESDRTTGGRTGLNLSRTHLEAHAGGFAAKVGEADE